VSGIEGTPCLLPGPAGKQVVRSADGRWFALSGRRRGERISDLVLSYSSVPQPAWSDFSHVTLIGPDAEALFADDDKDITAALLSERESMLFVVFSWNSGVFSLRFDLSAPDLDRRIGSAEQWRNFDADPFRRPEPIINSQLGNGLLFDAVADKSGCAVLCRDRMKAKGAGFEVLDGEDGVSFVMPRRGESQIQANFYPGIGTCCATLASNGDYFVALQQSSSGTIEIGQFGSPRVPVPLQGQFALSMPLLIDRGFVLATPVHEGAADTTPVAITWNVSKDLLRTPIDILKTELRDVGSNQAAFPAVMESDPAVLLVERAADGQPPQIAYESLPPSGSTTAGVLLGHGGQLEFRQISIRPLSTTEPVEHTE
jgi:hypothetical protein